MHNKRSSLERIPLMVKQLQDKHKFTAVGHNAIIVAKTFVVVICIQLRNIPCIFRHCDLLVLNKSNEKKLQIKNNSFTDCHDS